MAEAREMIVKKMGKEVAEEAQEAVEEEVEAQEAVEEEVEAQEAVEEEVEAQSEAVKEDVEEQEWRLGPLGSCRLSSIFGVLFFVKPWVAFSVSKDKQLFTCMTDWQKLWITCMLCRIYYFHLKFHSTFWHLNFQFMTNVCVTNF